MRNAVRAAVALVAMLVVGSTPVPMAPAVTAASPDPADTPAPLLEDEGSAQPLEGTRWRLTDYRFRDTQRSTGADVAAALTLVGGKVRGSSGCNKLQGRYATVGRTIDFEVERAGGRSCAEQTMIVERGLLDGLKAATAFMLAPTSDGPGADLVVLDFDGAERLRFRPDDASVLSAGRWRLEAYTSDGIDISADAMQAAVLAFEADRSDARRRRAEGDAVGSSGCNAVLGRYFQDANVLSFGPLETTDAPCVASLAAQEAAMLAVLDATSIAIDLPPDGLILTSSDSGEQLRFVSTSPLEGSTWLLDRLGGQDMDLDVTLRLDGGRASGEGPCGPFTASYVSDGRRLAFEELSGPGTGGCASKREQRRFDEALRRTVVVDRSSAWLDLLDPFGRTVARFSHPGAP